MHPQLAQIVRQFEEAQARVHRLASVVPERRWAVRAEPERWSVAECVAHLNLTSRAFLPELREGLEQARALGEPAPGRYRRDILGWLLARGSGPMLRVGGRPLGRVRTMPAFVPQGAQPRDELLAEFDRLQAEQISLTRGSDGLPVQRVKVVSPFDARVRYNLFAALTILPGHQHRHLDQAEQVWAARPA